MMFRYCDTALLDSKTNEIAYDSWRANGCYDPYVATGGHQPLGWDNMSSFWNAYIVVSSKMTAVFSNSVSSADYGSALAVGVYLSDGLTSVPTALITMAEQGLSKWTYTARSQTRGSAVNTATCAFNARSFFNLSDIKDNVETYGALVTDDPSRGAYYRVWCGSTNLSEDPGTITVFVTIEYTVEFNDPKTLTIS
jgi:hypothetical protein